MVVVVGGAEFFREAAAPRTKLAKEEFDGCSGVEGGDTGALVRRDARPRGSRHRAQKWRSTTQPLTGSTKPPPIPGALLRRRATAEPARRRRPRERAKEACLAGCHSRRAGSPCCRLAFSSWPAWPDSAPDFSRSSGSRASSTSLIHGKLANVSPSPSSTHWEHRRSGVNVGVNVASGGGGRGIILNLLMTLNM